MESINKLCSRCKQEKSISDFWRNKSNPSGFQSSCKECHALSVNKAYKKRGARARNLWLSYKITIEQFNAILESQENKCAICKISPPNPQPNRFWHIDHDHSCCEGKKTCGKCVRGILCHGCNLRLGLFESVKFDVWFGKADMYLRKSL